MSHSEMGRRRYVNDPPQTRFDRNYTPEPQSGCWLWTAHVDPNGYGRMKAFGQDKAHRVSVILSGREIPRGASVLHSCDQPSCVNPAHLRIGTHAENMQDKKARGRCVSVRVLSNEAVAEARRLRRNGWMVKSIAERLGAAETTISNICNGRTRTNVP